ncbi:HsdR family type I site-specific deoxyribonuclease [Aliivibrio fischeri]|uniref:type I restriction endonuclease subunit R n=1 Tax=Aliivibrio fischeri TaxID=668 RepID=UPI0012D95596|nr:type I restriction endonuclease subunit R [Aliivibrio fischeri]MUH96338.1 HsdR family type I site-specific deoxyribonuclease [Aliivibrio fischeri]MUI63908.1 HsdR family type I site-specific deoxyribonuclease [Aliivibrio fischeri]
MKFTEERLEQAIIELLRKEGYPHTRGEVLERAPEDVLIKSDLREFLAKRYQAEGITAYEIEQIIHKFEYLPASDLYDTNKAIMKFVSDGFLLKREDASQKDLYIQLIDYVELDNNRYRIVNQMEIQGYEQRIPDGILYINGLPLVVFEFKSAIREEATIYDAYKQLTTRYDRDIPELFKYNALCVISDGVNNKMGSYFAPYEFFYSWRKITGEEKLDKDGIDSLFTMISGLFNKQRLTDVIRHFIYIPDTSSRQEKIVCRYPQYYAATKLFSNIKQHMKCFDEHGKLVSGDGKGGTYFGATGCGKSYTMLFLSRLLMKDVELGSPTIILITDRTDLDDQLAGQFTNAKAYVGDQNIISVESRAELREHLKGRKSGGVFLTTIHKFTEDLELLTERTNVICISDEAHRSQTNLEQKITVTEDGVKKTYGFAKYLHDSLPNATYVGFTGTPIDATLDVFGAIVDSYTMTESVFDEITVRIVYEGRAAKVLLDGRQLEQIEKYYKACEDAGTNEYQIDKSKKEMASMSTILGDPDRIKSIAKDFVEHYENRVEEGSTQKGKAMFVCSSRDIAYHFYKELLELRPEWDEVKVCEDGATLSESDKKKVKPMERVKMIMTRNKDDDKALWNKLGNKEYRKELDRQFKNGKSNFKIAIVVDMWLTGFDVPFLDTIYIDKPLQKHNLIQTISRVNRKFEGKENGLVVDYIGIKKQMNLALSQYTAGQDQNLEDIKQSVIIVKDHLSLLDGLFYKFDSEPYFNGTPLEQLHCLNASADFALRTKKFEKTFMDLTKRLKSAYDICVGSSELTKEHKDKIHYYLAVRTIVFKITTGGAPDVDQMNCKVRDLVKDALMSDGVEEIFKLGEKDGGEIDIFDDDYLAKLEMVKQPNTKLQLLQQMLAKAIGEFKKTNKVKGVDFTKKMNMLVEKYNERDEKDVLRSEVINDFSDEIIKLYNELRKEMASFGEMGIDFEEKAFYDILISLAHKYDFTYPEEKLLDLSKEVKKVIDDKAKYTDWNKRDDIKADLHFDLVILLDEWGYPPIDRDEVYKEIFEQAENFKRNNLNSTNNSELTSEPIPLLFGDKKLYRASQISRLGNTQELATITFKADLPYERDFETLFATGYYTELKELGIISSVVLDTTMTALTELELATRELDLPLYENGKSGIVWALNTARDGSIYDEFIAYAVDVAGDESFRTYIESAIYDIAKTSFWGAFILIPQIIRNKYKERCEANKTQKEIDKTIINSPNVVDFRKHPKWVNNSNESVH